jgi:O-acetylhomoserine (thiol)-lyase
MKFTTKVLHNSYPQKDVYGALRFPVYGNASFEFESAEDIESAFEGKKTAYVYSRSSNPTVDYFEKTIASVTGALGVVGFSSGMGAISNAILAVAQSGDEIISSNNLFGTTYSFFVDTLPRLGINVKFVNFQDTNAIKQAISDKTRALFFETISNPQIEIYPIEEIVKIAQENKILSIADCTPTPPYLFNSKDFGIDISVLSSTKFISGGGTALGGLIIDNGIFNWGNNPNFVDSYKQYGNFSFIRKLRLEIFRNLGSCMSPQSASSFLLGLETMELRIDRACSNAQKVAEYLSNHSKVKSVRYAGLENSKSYERSKKFFLYPGSIICFELENKQSCFKFINSVKIIRRSTNIHDNKSLIIHPASTIYCEFSETLKIEMDVLDTMIRLSVGIENYEDLENDLKLSFNNL